MSIVLVTWNKMAQNYDLVIAGIVKSNGIKSQFQQYWSEGTTTSYKPVTYNKIFSGFW